MLGLTMAHSSKSCGSTTIAGRCKPPNHSQQWRNLSASRGVQSWMSCSRLCKAMCSLHRRSQFRRLQFLHGKRHFTRAFKCQMALKHFERGDAIQQPPGWTRMTRLALFKESSQPRRNGISAILNGTTSRVYGVGTHAYDAYSTFKHTMPIPGQCEQNQASINCWHGLSKLLN